jgi:predicted GH43/DUF377 family glycosyl hydrolase
MKLKRYSENPVLSSNPKNKWESKAVFNPAVFLKDKKVHLLYRAIGEYESYISRIGYAWSEDGIKFRRMAYPIFEPKTWYEKWGCEDPRATLIGKEIYIIYIAVSERNEKPAYSRIKNKVSWAKGKWGIGLASTSDLKDFRRYGIISTYKSDKDAALFPEKIGGKWAMLHRIEPDIWISYSHDLIHWHGDKPIMRPRKGEWDSVKIGTGAPPIKTPKGWLLFYHGVDEENVYRLGVALFDLNNPAKLLSRQAQHILEPRESYELEGDVPKVVFTCGAIEMAEQYWVYYGCADKVISLARIEKAKALDFI